MIRWVSVLSMLLAFGLPADAQNVPTTGQTIAVDIDTSAARGVLNAVRDTELTMDKALAVARMPGNQGLIRKSLSNDLPATDKVFAEALVAASRQDTGYNDVGHFNFATVRENADVNERVLAAFDNPSLRLIDKVKQRVVTFSPTTANGTITGYLVVGGGAGGFAFDEPSFFLNLNFFRSSEFAATIMEHELFHAVQVVARSGHKKSHAHVAACTAKTKYAKAISDAMFDPLMMEGTASYVGDVLALPKDSNDAEIVKAQTLSSHNINLLARSISILELSIHGIATESWVTPSQAYALGYYGDQLLYDLGYVMTRAIVKEEGNSAVHNLIGLPGAHFVNRYAQLKSYGKNRETPALGNATIEWAERVAGCSDGI